MSDGDAAHGLTLEGGDPLIQVNRVLSISPFQCVVMFVAGNYGLGLARHGRFLRGGFILATMSHLIMACVSYYSLWMLSYVAQRHQSFQYEELWRRCGYRGSVVIGFLMFVSCEGWIILYFGSVLRLWVMIVDVMWPAAHTVVKDKFIVTFALLVVLFAPIILRRDKLAHFIGACVKCGLIIALMALSVQWMIHYRENYVVENKVVHLFDASWLITLLGDYMNSYTNYPLFFWAFGSMKDLTLARLRKYILISLIIVVVGNEFVSYIQFFTLYGDREADMIWGELDVNLWSARFGLFLWFAYVALTLPPFLEPVRTAVLSLAQQLDSYPRFIWSSTGLVWMIVSVLVAAITGSNLMPLWLGLLAVGGLMQMGFPAIMLIKHMGELPKAHWLGIIILIGMSALAFVAGIYLLVASDALPPMAY
jgi:hypothetical protein